MTRSSRRRSSAARAACAVAALSIASSALAGPEARVRVRGGSRIDATATATSEGFVLKGTLLEDAGRPVASARIRVRQLGLDGSTRLLRPGEPCTTPAIQDANGPYRGNEEVSATTDAAGRFCLRWPFDLPEGRLVLAFDDPRALLDSAEQSVEIQRSAPFDIELARPPRTLSLDVPEASIEVATRARDDTENAPLPLTLLWTRVGAPTTTLLTRSLRPGESATLRFPTRALGGPGPGELRARLGSGERSAEVSAQLVATASVRLQVPTSLTLPAGGEGALNVDVTSSAGPVGTGSVEALTGDRTVGIAPVSGGGASVPLSLGAGPFTTSVTVRYLPASPWWLAGPPERVAISVPRASRWRAAFWAAALIAIAAYITASWRRPPRLSTRQAAFRTAPPETATVSWSAPAKGIEGWIGTVNDAHDGTPIAGATVVATLGSGVEGRAVTEPDGSFRLLPFGSPSAGSRIRIEAQWHSPFEAELPPHGSVSITLITRRRALLARLVAWTRRRGAPWAGVGEPTPGELARSAEAVADRKVATWARAVEVAAFGPAAVDPAEEARIHALEPDAVTPDRRPSERNDPA